MSGASTPTPTVAAAPVAPHAGHAAVPSLQRRLSRFVWLLTLTWIIVTTLVLSLWLRHEVDELLDDSLVATSETLAAVLSVQAADGPPLARPQVALQPSAEATQRRDETTFAWQVVDASGRIIQRSHNAPPQLLAAQLAAGFVEAQGNWRVRARPLGAGRWLLVGQEIDERIETTLEVAGGTVCAALLVSLAGLAWLRWRLARETRPLAELGAVLARYDPLRANGPLPLPPPALQELAPVHAAVQKMGERLAAHAAAERAFSAHAAHALRTPLAGLEAQLAVAQREAPPALQSRLARLRGATGRLSHVVGALLALFRSSGALQRTRVDVAALLARVPFEGLVFEFDEPVALPEADEDLLAAALINLLDNSLRHGARKVRLQVADGHVTLTDDGPGVDEARRAQLRQALVREDAGLAAHDAAVAGLGLALADRVARAHGGRLELLEVPLGFAVRLWLQAPWAAAATAPQSPAASTALTPPSAPVGSADDSGLAHGAAAAAQAPAGTLRGA